MQLKTQLDFDDLILGAKILGCGGGGEESLARSLVKFILDNSLSISIINPNDLPHDALLCVTGMVGGRRSPTALAHIANLSVIDPWPMFTATSLLESHLNSKIHALVSTEIGAGNFLISILVSARLGINVLDGDLCGRAKPEISISTSNILDIPITPLALVSSVGDKLILHSAQTDQRAESIVRNLAVLSGGSVSVARCPAYWSDYCKAVIPNTLSLAKNLGLAVRTAQESNTNPIKTILTTINGQILFSGVVQSFTARDEGGFVIGNLILENNHNQVFKIWFKNEYLVTWLNNQPFVTAPDLICVVDTYTGEGLTPWSDDFSINRSVVVIGKKNHPLWYSQKGLTLFGPQHFGFDFTYQPFEKITAK
ncbi:MAG: DUF917 domain-containing protein [Candidatus Heimdallarchaeota archaeon]|nr:DUF917 domain-containing protein [Candidatus Heimdallarchaeota archaeon]